MVWRTMSEWNEKGKSVIKGSKCLLRDPKGNCLFNEFQVEKRVYNRNPQQWLSYKGRYSKCGGNYQKHDYDNWDLE